MREPTFTLVPDVVGLQEPVARATLLSATLAVGSVTESHSLSVPLGAVISQSPAAGQSVLEGSEVALEISTGPVLVPNVVNTEESQARAVVLAAELTVGAVRYVEDLIVAEGLVISQSPVAGAAVLDGEPVALVISLGVPKVAVPDLLGLPLSFGEDSLVATNLFSGAVSSEYRFDVPGADRVDDARAGHDRPDREHGRPRRLAGSARHRGP